MFIKLRRITAAFLSGVLFLTQVVLAHSAESNLWSERRRNIRNQTPLLAQLPQTQSLLPPLGTSFVRSVSTSQLLPKNISKNANVVSLITAVSQNGLVRDIKLGHGQHTVLLVQDVHGNDEAQRNISSIILNVLEENPTALVGLEGASGRIPMEKFRGASVEMNKEVGSFFLNTGLITGAEYAGFANKESPRLFGVEGPNLYFENIEAVKASLKKQKEQLVQIEKEKRFLQEEKIKVYSAKLLLLDEKGNGYHDGALNVGDYLSVLNSLMGPNDTIPESISLFLKTWALEKRLNFDQAERERNVFLTQIMAKLSRSDLDHFLQQSVALQSGQIRYPDYYRMLKDTALKAGVSMKATPEFDRYITYVHQSDAIQPEELLRELSEFEKAVWKQLCETPEQKALYEASHRLMLTDKLVRLTLTPAEWEEYKAVIPAQAGIQVSNNILKKAYTLDPGFRRGDVSPFERFYLLAESRNSALSSNLKKHLAETKSNMAILVAGGFHTDGLKALLKDNATIITVTPKLTKVDSTQDNEYLNVFTREKTPLEKLFESPKISIVKPLVTGQSGPTAVSKLSRELLGVLAEVGPKGSAKVDYGNHSVTAAAPGHAMPSGSGEILLHGQTEQGVGLLIRGRAKSNGEKYRNLLAKIRVLITRVLPALWNEINFPAFDKSKFRAQARNVWKRIQNFVEEIIRDLSHFNPLAILMPGFGTNSAMPGEIPGPDSKAIKLYREIFSDLRREANADLGPVNRRFYLQSQAEYAGELLAHPHTFDRGRQKLREIYQQAIDDSNRFERDDRGGIVKTILSEMGRVPSLREEALNMIWNFEVYDYPYNSIDYRNKAETGQGLESSDFYLISDIVNRMSDMVRTLLISVGNDDEKFSHRLMQLRIQLSKWSRKARVPNEYLALEFKDLVPFSNLLPDLEELAQMASVEEFGNVSVVLADGYVRSGQYEKALRVLSRIRTFTYFYYEELFSKIVLDPQLEGRTVELAGSLAGPNPIGRLVMMGDALRKNGYQEKSNSIYRKAWAKSRGHSNHHRHIALFFARVAREAGVEFESGVSSEKLLTRAKENARLVIDIEPDGIPLSDFISEPIYEVIFELAMSGRYDEAKEIAISLSRKAFPKDDPQVDNMSNRKIAVAAACRGDWEELTFTLRDMTGLRPETSYEIAMALVGQGKFKEALNQAAAMAENITAEGTEIFPGGDEIDGKEPQVHRMVGYHRGDALVDVGRIMLDQGFETGVVGMRLIQAARLGLDTNGLEKLFQLVDQNSGLRNFVLGIAENAFRQNLSYIRHQQHRVLLKALRKFFPEIKEIEPESNATGGFVLNIPGFKRIAAIVESIAIRAGPVAFKTGLIYGSLTSVSFLDSLALLFGIPTLLMILHLLRMLSFIPGEKFFYFQRGWDAAFNNPDVLKLTFWSFVAALPLLGLPAAPSPSLIAYALFLLPLTVYHHRVDNPSLRSDENNLTVSFVDRLDQVESFFSSLVGIFMGTVYMASQRKKKDVVIPLLPSHEIVPGASIGQPPWVEKINLLLLEYSGLTDENRYESLAKFLELINGTHDVGQIWNEKSSTYFDPTVRAKAEPIVRSLYRIIWFEEDGESKRSDSVRASIITHIRHVQRIPVDRSAFSTRLIDDVLNGNGDLFKKWHSAKNFVVSEQDVWRLVTASRYFDGAGFSEERRKRAIDAFLKVVEHYEPAEVSKRSLFAFLENIQDLLASASLSPMDEHALIHSATPIRIMEAAISRHIEFAHDEEIHNYVVTYFERIRNWNELRNDSSAQKKVRKSYQGYLATRNAIHRFGRLAYPAQQPSDPPLHENDLPFIPPGLDPSKPITRIVIATDVDGVLRPDDLSPIDPRIVEELRQLDQTGRVTMAAISGSPTGLIETDDWRRDGLPIGPAFHSAFSSDYSPVDIGIYGNMGSQSFHWLTGAVNVIDSYSPQEAFDGLKLLLKAYLTRVKNSRQASRDEQNLAEGLLTELHQITLPSGLPETLPSSLNLSEFKAIMEKVTNPFAGIMKAIRNEKNGLNPGLALIWRGTAVQLGSTMANKFGLEDLVSLGDLDAIESLRNLPSAQKNVHGDHDYFKITKVSKAQRAELIFEGVSKKADDHILYISIGDGRIDIPMHKTHPEAHLGYHVGREATIDEHLGENIVFIRKPDGGDQIKIDGTRELLRQLREALVGNKKFGDYRIFFHQHIDGKWGFVSANEMRQSSSGGYWFNIPGYPKMAAWFETIVARAGPVIGYLWNHGSLVEIPFLDSLALSLTITLGFWAGHFLRIFSFRPGERFFDPVRAWNVIFKNDDVSDLTRWTFTTTLPLFLLSAPPLLHDLLMPLLGLVGFGLMLWLLTAIHHDIDKKINIDSESVGPPSMGSGDTSKNETVSSITKSIGDIQRHLLSDGFHFGRTRTLLNRGVNKTASSIGGWFGRWLLWLWYGIQVPFYSQPSAEIRSHTLTGFDVTALSDATLRQTGAGQYTLDHLLTRIRNWNPGQSQPDVLVVRGSITGDVKSLVQTALLTEAPRELHSKSNTYFSRVVIVVETGEKISPQRVLESVRSHNSTMDQNVRFEFFTALPGAVDMNNLVPHIQIFSLLPGLNVLPLSDYLRSARLSSSHA